MAIEGEALHGSSHSHVAAAEIWPESKRVLGLILAFGLGWLIWQLPSSDPLDENGIRFLAALAAAVTLWVLEVFDEYIVGLMLLLSWVVLGMVPSKVALAGFSETSWFFIVGALGMGAAVNKTGLLHRLSVQLLSRIPLACYKTYTFCLLVFGLLTTPLLPTGKARTVIAVPVSQTLSEATGFEPRSNGSAALALSALAGFSQMSFMFLTGGEFCLLGWNLLPPSFKSEFGWLTWFVAAFPAGILTLLFVFGSIHLFFPLQAQEKTLVLTKAIKPSQSLGAFTQPEWIVLATLTLTLTGWLTMPVHGINEAWIAVAALLIFLITGVLDKKSFKNNLDWGLILFFGIVNSIAAVSSHLEVDRWLTNLVEPVLNSFSLNPTTFLVAVVLVVCCARFFLRKAAVVTFFTLTLAPLGQEMGIHPGVLLLTIVMSSECFFLAYQDGPYQIAYSSTQGLAFSNGQARKILAVRFIATLAAVTLSVPYWKALGFIH
jgi:anion transporter